MTTSEIADRSYLDFLENAAHSAHIARDLLDLPLGCLAPEWRTAHETCAFWWGKVRDERVRLWKADRWGKWMTKHDRALATITGELN